MCVSRVDLCKEISKVVSRLDFLDFDLLARDQFSKGPDARIMEPQMSPWSCWSGSGSSLGNFQHEGFRINFLWTHASHVPTLFVSLVQTSCPVSRCNILLNIVAPGWSMHPCHKLVLLGVITEYAEPPLGGIVLRLLDRWEITSSYRPLAPQLAVAKQFCLCQSQVSPHHPWSRSGREYHSTGGLESWSRFD